MSQVLKSAEEGGDEGADGAADQAAGNGFVDWSTNTDMPDFGGFDAPPDFSELQK